MAGRERFQLVVSLGEGADGQRLREVIDRAAEKTGKPVTVWAREILLTAAGDSESTLDPIVEVKFNGNETTLLDLRLVTAIQTGPTRCAPSSVRSGSRSAYRHQRNLLNTGNA